MAGKALRLRGARCCDSANRYTRPGRRPRNPSQSPMVGELELHRATRSGSSRRQHEDHRLQLRLAASAIDGSGPGEPVGIHLRGGCVAVQEVHHWVAASLLLRIARRQADEYGAIDAVAGEIALQALAVDGDLLDRTSRGGSCRLDGPVAGLATASTITRAPSGAIPKPCACPSPPDYCSQGLDQISLEDKSARLSRDLTRAGGWCPGWVIQTNDTRIFNPLLY